MSEDGDRDSGKAGAFLLGFLVGVLVCLGAGGTFAFVQVRRVEEERMRAVHAEMMAREAAEEARQRERAEWKRLEKAAREAEKEMKRAEKEMKRAEKEKPDR
jgi:uncharacterized protein HemX